MAGGIQSVNAGLVLQ